MLITKKELNKILHNWRISSIPKEMEKEILEAYGHAVVTEEGLTIECSEQDICEQLRKILRPYMQEVNPNDPSF